MPTVTWNPLVQQVAEADTLYMFDADAEKLLTAGAGGFIMANAQGGDVPWTGTSLVRDVAGKFLRGIHCYVRSNGFMWMPIEGLLGASEFTIEFFVKGDVSWANAFGANLFSVTMANGEQMTLDLHQNVMVLRLMHNQAAAAVSRAIVYTPSPTIPIGQWVSIGITFSGTTMKLYVDGVLVGTDTSSNPPAVWSCTGATTGLTLLGFNGAGADGWSLSDLKISRKARVPGVPISVDNLNTLTVTPATATGATVNQDLLGGLLTLDGTATEVMATTPTQALTGLRSGKYISTAPIKAGGTDGTHPTAGISGQWAYDWRVADRTFAYHTRLGMKTIGDIGSTPTLLGGNQVPYSGGQLTNDVNHPSSRSDWANYCSMPPSNNTQWGQMVRDLVHHTVNELSHPVPWWGVGNEPDSTWTGSQAQYHAMYAASVAAAKQVDPTTKVGGPETSDWNPDWVKNLIQYCAANGVTLDYVSWHFYSGELGEIQRAKSQVALWAAQYGLSPVPAIAVSEWCWTIYNTTGTGVLPWRNYQYHRNDWHAAWAASSLMEMQRLGVLYGVFTSPVAMDGVFGTAPDGLIQGFDSVGLMSNTTPWGNLNVFRQWSLLKPTVVSSSYVGQPGVFAQASKDGSGLVTIMVSHLRYRKDLTPNLKIQLPSGYSGAPVTHYIVDGTHSNLMDAGAGHEDLETISSSAIDGSNSLTVALPPRSSHVFVIGTPSADTTPPQTTITVSPPNGTATSVSFSFTSSEAGSTFETRMDGGSWVVSTSPKAYTGLSVGSHTFDVRAIDPATNVDPSPATYTWQVTATGGGGGPGPPVTAGLVADYNPALIVGTDGTAVEAADQSGLNHHAVQATGTKRPLLKTNIINGLPVLRFDGVDDFLQASFTLPQPAHVFVVAKFSGAYDTTDTVIDGASPDSRMRIHRSDDGTGNGHQITAIAQGTGITKNLADEATVFHSYEVIFNGASSEIRLDGGTAATGDTGTATPAGVTLGAVASGGNPAAVDVARVLVYNVALASTDRVAVESFINNTYFGAAPGDTTPPVTTITSSPANSTSQSATFVFSANEPSTFETNLDGAAWVASTSPKSYTGLSVGQHTFQVRATDIAANLETTPKTHTWTISAPPPQSSVTAEELWLTDPRIGIVMNSNAMQGDKLQTAIDLALSDPMARGTLRLNPGYVWCDRELSYARSNKILHIVGSGASEDGTSGSAIYWPELGTGKFPILTSEVNANYPMEWRDFTMIGPATRNGYGDDMSDMWGPKLYGRSLLERVNVLYFKTGIIAKADHHDFYSCNFGGNSYGLYFGINDGQGGGDFTFVNVKATGCRKASIGIGTTHALGGFTFIQGHYGFSPTAIHRFEEGAGLQRRIPFLEHGDFINTPFEACGPQGVIWDEPGDGWISDVRFSTTGEAGEPMFDWPGKPDARGLWDLGGIADVYLGGDIAPWDSPAAGIDKPLIYATQAIVSLRCAKPGYAMSRVHAGSGHTLLEAPAIEDVLLGFSGARAGGVSATCIKSEGALARYDAVELIGADRSTYRVRKARNANPYVGQVVAPTVDGAAAFIATHGVEQNYIKAVVTLAVRAGQTLVVDPANPGKLKPGGIAYGSGTVARAVTDIAAGATGAVKIDTSQAS